jgi:hypothetical protein
MRARRKKWRQRMSRKREAKKERNPPATRGPPADAMVSATPAPEATRVPSAQTSALSASALMSSNAPPSPTVTMRDRGPSHVTFRLAADRDPGGQRFNSGSEYDGRVPGC